MRNIKYRKNKKYIFNSKPEGKFRSQLEKIIYNRIKRYDQNLKILINEKKRIGMRKMELDMYFPELEIGVEIQGPSHTFSPQIIIRDYVKKKCFEKEGIPLVYIYTDNYKMMNECLNKVSKIINTNTVIKKENKQPNKQTNKQTNKKYKCLRTK